MSEETKKEDPKVTQIQHIIVQFSDGRKGVFAGPAVIGKAELMLKPPIIAEVVICDPRDIVDPTEEKPSDAVAPKAE